MRQDQLRTIFLHAMDFLNRLPPELLLGQLPPLHLPHHLHALRMTNTIQASQFNLGDPTTTA